MRRSIASWQIIGRRAVHSSRPETDRPDWRRNREMTGATDEDVREGIADVGEDARSPRGAVSCRVSAPQAERLLQRRSHLHRRKLGHGEVQVGRRLGAACPRVLPAPAVLGLDKQQIG